MLLSPTASHSRDPAIDQRAFSRIELLTLISALGLLTAVFVRAQVAPDNRPALDRIRCSNNLKHINLAFRMWSIDHDEKFPMQFGANKGGSRDAINKQQPWLHF